MPASLCSLCGTARASILRPKDGSKLCKTCFLWTFEEEVHETITRYRLFRRPHGRGRRGPKSRDGDQNRHENGDEAARVELKGERVAIGASGGKDSTVLASVLTTLNARHNYGLDLCLLSIDEGIRGYRDDSLAAVARFSASSGLPLRVLGYRELYGWTMDEVVGQIGRKGNCTYCGVFRRQALDRGARLMGVRHVVTGHNADDLAETVVMNLLRGDLARVGRASEIVTGDDGLKGRRRRRRERDGVGEGGRDADDQEDDQKGDEEDEEDEQDEDNDGDDTNCECPEHPAEPIDRNTNTKPSNDWQIKRSKPLKYAYEKEIVLYALHKGLDYFSTECIYSPEAFRGSARTLIKQLERIRPSSILETVHSGEQMARLVPGKRENKRGGGLEVDDDEAGVSAAGGCGKSSGRNGGGEMAAMEALLRAGAHIDGRNERRLNDVDSEIDFTTTTTTTTTTNSTASPIRAHDNPTKHLKDLNSSSQSDSSKSSSNRHCPKALTVNASNMTPSVKANSPQHSTTSLPPVQHELGSGPRGVGKCTRCGYMSSQSVCKACMLLEGLNRNRPKMGIRVDDDNDDVVVANGTKDYGNNGGSRRDGNGSGHESLNIEMGRLEVGHGAGK